MNRRKFLNKLLTGTSSTVKPSNIVAQISKPVKDTVNAAIAYDRDVRSIKRNGNKFLNRRRLLNNFKNNVVVKIATSPKESTDLIKQTSSKLRNLTLDPVEIALKPYKNKMGKLTKLLSKFYFMGESVEFNS